MRKDKELLEISRRLHQARGEQAYHLDVFGDTLAQREGYKDIDGMEAVYLYLIRTHHWLPRDVRSMSQDDLLLALHVEMQGWTVPPEAVDAAGR
jgi:hypothetical protein